MFISFYKNVVKNHRGMAFFWLFKKLSTSKLKSKSTNEKSGYLNLLKQQLPKNQF